MVMKAINIYLANIWYYTKDANQTLHLFVVLSVFVKNLVFIPFNITLDWKDQNDAGSKFSEVDIQIKKNNYAKQIFKSTVFNIFRTALQSVIFQEVNPYK